MRLAPLAIALLACLSVAACGKNPQEAAVSAATGGKVDMEQDGDKTTIKTAEGQMTVNSGANQPLPASFPADAFLPDGYSVKTSAEFGGATILDLQVPGDMAAVADAASQGMQAKAWKQSMSMNQNDARMLMFEKDGRVATYTVTKDPDGPGSRLAVQVAEGKH
jgi:hypothetical protein